MSTHARRSLRLAAPAIIAALLLSFVLGSPAGAAQSRVGLGTATSFSVLAGSGITNTGATTVNGNIGSHPTPTIVEGAPGITYNGGAVNHAGNATTQSAKADLLTAYDDAGSRLPNIAQDAELGGELLTEGVYQGGATGLTGDLTLNFQGSDTTQFIFKLTALTTASDSNVVIQNPGPAGTEACRVVWQISSSATFGTETDFVGDVLAHTSITANTGADFDGRLLALNGAVTLQNNTIDIGSCTQVAPTPTTTTTAAPTTTTTIDDGNGRRGGGGSGFTIPTTSTTSTTSTTAAPTTTTTAAPATSTTAVAPTTTSTLLPVVVDTIPDGPVAIAGFPSPPGVDLQVVPPGTPPSRPELPRTGSETVLLAVVGGSMVLLGSAIVRIEGRTRRTRAV